MYLKNACCNFFSNIENDLPMAWAKAITTSWQVVASVTPQTTLWTPSTQTLSSMLGQKREGRFWCVGPDIIEGSRGAGQLKSLWLLYRGRKKGKQETVSKYVLKAGVVMISVLKG